jgi:protein TonB
LGWVTAGAAALCLVGGAAALALAAERRENVLIIDLGTTPPSAPALAAVSEAAPDIVATDPSLPTPSDSADTLPSVPEATTSPVLPAAAPMSQPKIEPPVPADLSLPSMPAKQEADPGPTTKPRPRPEARPDPKPADEVKTEPKPIEPSPEALVQNDKTTSSASAPSVAAKAKGSALSPAAYARAVMKKVRATKRKSGAGKGSVVVGFTIAPDGSLASVQVLQSSGNAALDAVAVDHIRRSEPFPPPGSNAGRGYSFQFVGK